MVRVSLKSSMFGLKVSPQIATLCSTNAVLLIVPLS